MSADLNKSIIYQIYPTSFYDSNGDGVGDLNGITEKLPYVKDLGADIVWINPIFKSPFKDGGYDVEDYCAIDKRFGTLDDFDNMIKTAHELGIKVLLDLVIGHTSDKHPWFKASKQAKRNKYSDYYVWTDSIFIGAPKAINGMAKRNGNYLVNYYAFQPALNFGYSNIEVNNDDPWVNNKWQMHYLDERIRPLHDEIHKILEFWFSRGVDGFRVDMTASLIKGGGLEALAWLWHGFIDRVREKYPDAIFMAEWGCPELSSKCGFNVDYFTHESVGYNDLFRGDPGTNLLPAFECGASYFGKAGKGSKKVFIENTLKLAKELEKGNYYCIPSGYHDMIRLSINKNPELLKCIFAFLLTYKNLPMIYYGDEIGMRHNFKVNKDGGYVRTGARTPMQWTDGKNRGFTENARPYLPVGKERSLSVEAQISDKNSLYNLVRDLIKLRKEYDAFGYDAELDIDMSEEYPLVYSRKANGKEIFVAINPTEKQFTIDKKLGKILYKINSEYSDNIKLDKYGFIIAEL